MYKHKEIDNEEISEFTYIPNFLGYKDYSITKDWLLSLSYIKGYNNSGKKIDREQIWFEPNNNYFCKVWKERTDRWQPHQYNNTLTKIQSIISTKTKVEIDSCLVNKYKDGNDIIAPHKDNSISFGIYPTIIIYSIGSTREMKINNDIIKKSKLFSLEDNSVFIMSGASQKYYTHEIIKSNTKNVRYSLTFRKYINK